MSGLLKVKPGFIRITKVPAGEAPKSVREQWVGLKLPCGHRSAEGPSVFGVESKESTARRPDCWKVVQSEALAVLEQKDAAAAQWFKDRGYPYEGLVFSFAPDEAEPIEGYIPSSNSDPNEN